MVHHEVLATPTIPAGQGVWTAYGSTLIQSSADTVWTAAKDFQSWGKWNPYTPKLEPSTSNKNLSTGERVTLHYRAAPTDNLMTVTCLCVDISDADRTLCLRGEVPGLPTWLLLPEKVHRVTPKGDNQCLYEIFETQSGPMAYLIQWSMGAKQSAMNQGIADALKKYVEEG